MGPTAEQLARAGALAQLCIRHASGSEAPNEWADTRLYAIRTFPQADVSEIDRLIRMCQVAADNVERLRTGRECRKCGV